jgi:hypothetical protein
MLLSPYLQIIAFPSWSCYEDSMRPYMWRSGYKHWRKTSCSHPQVIHLTIIYWGAEHVVFTFKDSSVLGEATVENKHGCKAWSPLQGVYDNYLLTDLSLYLSNNAQANMNVSNLQLMSLRSGCHLVDLNLRLWSPTTMFVFFFSFVFFFFFFWARVSTHSPGWPKNYYIVQASFEFKIFLPQPAKCWDCRHASP